MFIASSIKGSDRSVVSVPRARSSFSQGDSYRHPTVFVVDENDQSRKSLTLLIESYKYTVREFISPYAIRSFCRDAHCCPVVLDVRMPMQLGLVVYEQLLREGKRLPVIFVTESADVPAAVKAMKLGAIDFLEKPFAPKDLIRGIDRALQLEAQWLKTEKEFTCLDEKIRRLTSGDRETVELLLAGYSNKRMAARLKITERAIELRRSRMMKRLEVHSLPELLELLITHQVLIQSRGALLPFRESHP